jgi:hypothetical protein
VIIPGKSISGCYESQQILVVTGRQASRKKHSGDSVRSSLWVVSTCVNMELLEKPVCIKVLYIFCMYENSWFIIKWKSSLQNSIHEESPHFCFVSLNICIFIQVSIDTVKGYTWNFVNYCFRWQFYTAFQCFPIMDMHCFYNKEKLNLKTLLSRNRKSSF